MTPNATGAAGAAPLESSTSLGAAASVRVEARKLVAKAHVDGRSLQLEDVQAQLCEHGCSIDEELGIERALEDARFSPEHHAMEAGGDLLRELRPKERGELFGRIVTEQVSEQDDPRARWAAEVIAMAGDREHRIGWLRHYGDVPKDAPEKAPLRFQFVDLAAIAQGKLEPPAVLHEGLIVEGKVNWLSGHPGNGKTTLAMWAAMQHMEAGGHVIWLDSENGALSATRRLIAVGVKEDALAERLHYVGFPALSADVEGFEPIRAALEDYPRALVVFDSASKALSQAGLSEDSNDDATKWTTNIVIPAREAGATVIVVDHVPKGATRSTPYPRGAGAKLADTDAHWYVEAAERFDREHAGKLQLTNHKDREGVLAPELYFDVGDGEGRLPITAAKAEGSPGSGLDDAVIATLAKHAPAEDDAISQNQVEKLADGRASEIRAALKRLANDPRAPAKVKTGPNHSLLYWHEDDGGKTV
jgi:hypothetical protein